MGVIARKVMEKYRGELWFSKLTITLIMSRSSIFASKMTMISDWLFFLIVLMIFILYKLFSAYPAFSSLLKFSLLFWCVSHFLLMAIPANPGDVLHKLVNKCLCNVFIFRLLSVFHWILNVNLIIKALNVISEARWSMLLVLLSV